MTTPQPAEPIAGTWPIGHRIGSFELRGAVSRSASGIVYRAWDHGLAINVAIKEHLPSTIAKRMPDGEVVHASPSAASAYANSLQAFIAVTHALAHCDHPALVRVLHLLTDHGTAYRVMPWVDGDTLHAVCRGLSRPPDEPALRELLDDLLGAIEAVHRTGITHGGVHASRILLRHDDRALLLGPCAGVADSGVAPDPSTDLRALADVVRYCVSGRLATADGQRVEPIGSIVKRLFIHDRTVRYGDEFMRVIDAAASLDPSVRPQSAAQFRERLRRAERVDADDSAVGGRTPADAAQLANSGAATDAAIAGMIDRAIATSMPPPAKMKPRRPQAKSAPLDPASRPASKPLLVGTRRAGIEASVFAVLLALVGFGAWHSLNRQGPTIVASAASVVGKPGSFEAPSPASERATPPPEVVRPLIASAAPSAGIEASPRLEVAPIEPKPTTVERASDESAAIRSPRQACGDRAQFSLYRCMQQQCARSVWTNHLQCLRFRATDQID